ncbi:hypothetical protein DESC_190102 [Desulfosarcina cetonica]|nr:hypothetical protein DESC_190102 [Desulfosarcina cetonica]
MRQGIDNPFVQRRILENEPVHDNVHAGIIHQPLHGVEIVRRGGRTGDVHRIFTDVKGGVMGLHFLDGVRADGGHGEAVAVEQIHGIDHGTGAVADHGDGRSPGRGLHGQGLGGRHELLEGVDGQDAGLVEGPFADTVAAAVGPGMGLGRLGRLSAAPGFVDHDGLGVPADDRSGRLQKFAAIAKPLDIGGQDLGAIIFREEGDHVGLIDLHPVTVGDHFIDADVLKRFHEAAAVGSALGDEGDIAPWRTCHSLVGLEKGIEAAVGIETADAIGTDDADAMLPRLALDRLFQLHGRSAQFLAAAGNDQYRVNPQALALVQNVRDHRQAHDHHGQIHAGGERFQAGITLLAEYRLAPQGDGIDRALVFVIDQAVGHRVTDLAGGGGSPQKGHALGLEEFLQMIGAGRFTLQ